MVEVLVEAWRSAAAPAEAWRSAAVRAAARPWEAAQAAGGASPMVDRPAAGPAAAARLPAACGAAAACSPGLTDDGGLLQPRAAQREKGLAGRATRRSASLAEHIGGSIASCPCLAGQIPARSHRSWKFPTRSGGSVVLASRDAAPGGVLGAGRGDGGPIGAGWRAAGVTSRRCAGVYAAPAGAMVNGCIAVAFRCSAKRSGTRARPPRRSQEVYARLAGSVRAAPPPGYRLFG